MTETPNNRIMKALFSIKTKLRFTYLKPDFSNINDVYINNITLWYFANSDHKKDNSETNTDGFQNNIVNDWIKDLSKLEYSKTTKGFELTETDFIKAEFKRFELFEVNKLNLAEKKQFDFYTDFLNKKLNSFEDFTTDKILKNEFDKIFKNDIGFTIFTKMFELYKTENIHLANFSFLFYAMEKDFLVCSQTEFVKFLRCEKYNIEIEKIDPRQSGTNKKTKLYNSIKEKYQSSTIKAQ